MGPNSPKERSLLRNQASSPAANGTKLPRLQPSIHDNYASSAHLKSRDYRGLQGLAKGALSGSEQPQARGRSLPACREFDLQQTSLLVILAAACSHTLSPPAADQLLDGRRLLRVAHAVSQGTPRAPVSLCTRRAVPNAVCSSKECKRPPKCTPECAYGRTVRPPQSTSRFIY
eukprot:1193444-Prorocentrum_minimum.AAC.4